MLSAYLDELAAVVAARLGAPKLRRGTKWWTPAPGQVIEAKAIDADRVLPEHRVGALGQEVRPVAMTIATRAAEATRERLGPDVVGDDEMFAVDMDAVAAAVDAAVSRILDVAGRHAAEVRTAILDADESAGDLDEVVERVSVAQRRGGAWVLMSGRTLANALRNDAALREAAALGVTHTQWLSRRDARVRATHAVADGSVRALGEPYPVGRFTLRFPADPTDLPASWPEVAGCRCGLLFKPPDKAVQLTLDLVAGERAAPDRVRETLRRLDEAAAPILAAPRVESTPRMMPAPPGLGMPGLPAVELPRPVVGFRMIGGAALDAVPGQLLTLPGPVVLGTAAPMLAGVQAETAAVLSVAVPAGTTVGVSGGAIVVPQGTTLTVVASSPGSIVATLA